MRPLSASELAPLEFAPGIGEDTREYISPSNRIGWLEARADEPGARYDIVIKDELGRVKLHKKNVGTETEAYGERVDMPAMMGEKLNISIENLKGAKKVQVFLN